MAFWPIFRLTNTAVFEAFKIVEISVRNLCNLPADVIGTNLMRKAFDCQKGILTNMSLPIAEREALSHLFAGAIGLYKNSHSHREVEISFNQAFEMLLLASHLLNVLDSIEKKANAWYGIFMLTKRFRMRRPFNIPIIHSVPTLY